ncbi:extracellular solute-binding protein [Bacillus sp. IITD106]|nr:extracellular solute-binding protein [Bacillus sp. IITD106]
MKKRFAIIIVSIVLILVGCNQGSGSKSSNGKESSNNNDEVVTIKFHHWYDTVDERLDLVIEKFEEKNPGIKVEAERLDPKGADEAMKALDLLAASGDQLDVIMQPDATNFSTRVGMGLFEPLDSLLKEMGVNPKDEFIVDMTSADGSYYGLPVHYLPWLTIINKDLLDKAGLEVPTDWTFDDFLTYAKKLTDDSGKGMDKQYGTYFADMYSPLYYMALFNQAENSRIVTSDGKSNVKDPNVKRSLEILEQAEKIDKSTLSYSDRVSQNLHYAWPYFNQKAAMNLLGGWMISRVGGYAQYPATFTTVFAPFPKTNKDDEILLPANINTVSVAATSKHKEESAKFAYFLATEGVILQEKYLSNWTKANTDELVDVILSKTDSPEFVDGESLKNVLKISKPTPLTFTPAYYIEAENVFKEQVELFLLDDQDIDTTIEKADEAVQRIIDTNK